MTGPLDTKDKKDTRDTRDTTDTSDTKGDVLLDFHSALGLLRGGRIVYTLQ